MTGDPTLLSTDNIVVDSSKHVITDRYRITINSITWTDEGEYQCILGVNTPETAYLIVSGNKKVSFCESILLIKNKVFTMSFAKLQLLAVISSLFVTCTAGILLMIHTVPLYTLSLKMLFMCV